MKEKIAYLRGLMEGMQLPDDNNGKLLRAIADCLDAIADEVEVESARMDVIEEQLDDVNDELEEYDELFDALFEDDADDVDDDEDEDYYELCEHPHSCHGHGHHGPHHGHGCCHGHHEHWMEGDEDFDGEAFLDSLNYLTCPNCGEMVALDDEALAKEPDPICPNCNAHIFGRPGEEKPEGEEK